jgi:hypothetical protein
MHVFRNLARVMFSVESIQIGCRSSANSQNVEFVQVMFRPTTRTGKTYVGCKYTHFITSSGNFRALFVSDRLTSSVKTHLASVGISQVCRPY